MLSDGYEMTNDDFTNFPRGIRTNLDPKVKKKKSDKRKGLKSCHLCRGPSLVSSPTYRPMGR